MKKKVKSKLISIRCKLNIALAMLDPSTPEEHFPQGRDNTLRKKLLEMCILINEVLDKK